MTYFWIMRILVSLTMQMIQILCGHKLFTCFTSNQMKVNPDKCYLLLSTPEESGIQIANGNNSWH